MNYDYQDKVINSVCACDMILSSTKEELVILDPCEHIFHKRCIRNHTKCRICNENIEDIQTMQWLFNNKDKNKKYHQRYVDLLCMKNMDNEVKIDYNNLISRIPKILELRELINNLHSNDNISKIIDQIIKVANIKINIVNEENYIECNKIIITNHLSRIDFLPILFKYNSKFLAANSVNNYSFGEILLKYGHLLLINREENNNTVKRVNELVNEGKIITINPEGFISHPKVLTRFRTGAFHANVPIQPIAIEYDKTIRDTNLTLCIFKLLSQDSINITLHILPLEYPPFDNNKIERIRKEMARIGNMELSRVSGRDIK